MLAKSQKKYVKQKYKTINLKQLQNVSSFVYKKFTHKVLQ